MEASEQRLTVVESERGQELRNHEISEGIERRRRLNRYAKSLPWHGHLVVVALAPAQLAMAVELERAFLSAMRTALLEPKERRESNCRSCFEIWEALVTHLRDPATDSRYFRVRDQWHRLEGESWKETKLSNDQIGQLERVPATSPFASRLAPEPASLPKSPGSVRREVEQLIDAGLPIVTSPRARRGFAFAGSHEELLEFQRSRRAHVETTLRRLEREAEAFARAEHWEREGGQLLPFERQRRAPKKRPEGYEHAARLVYAEKRNRERELPAKVRAYIEDDRRERRTPPPSAPPVSASTPGPTASGRELKDSPETPFEIEIRRELFEPGWIGRLRSLCDRHPGNTKVRVTVIGGRSYRLGPSVTVSDELREKIAALLACSATSVTAVAG